MGRIAEKNPTYRTREVMASDVARSLSSSLSHGGKSAILKDVMWVWTEFYGKYTGCPYWTPAAIAEETSNPLPASKKYRHEHVVPKSLLVEMLFDMGCPTEDQVFQLLNRLLIGVVVTRNEDDALNVEYRRSMPPEFYDPTSLEYQDPWCRYRRCGIVVVDRASGHSEVDRAA